jgi:ribonuclease HI
MEFIYALRFEFTATNNEAEYEALIAGIRDEAKNEPLLRGLLSPDSN